MGRTLKIVIPIVAVLGIIGGLYFFKYKPLEKKYIETAERLEVLEREKQEIGDTVDCYELNHSVKRGEDVKEGDFEQVTLPISKVPENAILDLSELKDVIYKTDFAQKTVLTKDIVSEYGSDDLVELRDITMEYLPTSLNVGDFVDFRVTLPTGENFIAIEHKKVIAINDKVLEVLLSEAEEAILKSVQVDRAKYKQFGYDWYVTKYTEPGIDKNIAPYYPVTLDSEVTVLLSPNIWDKTRCINSPLRKYIDNKLYIASLEENADASALISSENAKVTGEIQSAYEVALDKRREEAERKAEEEMMNGDDFDTVEQPEAPAEEAAPAE